MKRMKKLISIMLAAVMMLAMTTTVFADDVTTTVTVNNLSGHTFAAYQIFSGTYSETTDPIMDVVTGTLSDVKWGTGVDSSSLLTKLQSNNTVVVASADNNNEGDITVAGLFKDLTDADDVAEVLENYAANSTLVNAFVEAAYAAKTTTSVSISSSTTSMAAGYYLIVDTTDDVTADGVSTAAYNNALLQVVGSSVTIDKKTAAPSVEKKVYEEDYSETGSDYMTGYNDVADYDIGDKISYQLIGTIPDTSEYSIYSYKFTDTLSKGLTADQSTVKVYLASKKNFDSDWVEIYTSNYTVNTEAVDSSVTGTYAGGSYLTVSFNDILSLVDSNEDKVSLSGYSYIIVTYTATLNSNAVIGLNGNPNEVYLTYSSNPNATDKGDNETENTPEDRVIVFTYELDVTKVDSKNTSTTLSGAEFVLYKTVSGVNYYVMVDSSNKVTGWTTYKNSEAATAAGASVYASTLKSETNGLFSVIGLDDGTYYLEETKAPTGYNLLTSVIELKIAATTNNGQTWSDGDASKALTALTITVDNNTADGVLINGTVSATVENTPGSGLPITGGMGTTILYIIGAILVIGAGVLLVTRRRLSR